MNKKSLLIFPICLLLAGCQIKLFGKTIKIFEMNSQQEQKEDENKDKDNTPEPGPEDITPEDPTTHATSCSATPNAPFYLKVGESKTVEMSLSPSPSKDEEKIFEWKLSGNSASYVVDTNTRKAVVTGVSAGTSYLTATNTFNDNLKKTFTINVIEFDEQKDYL